MCVFGGELYRTVEQKFNQFIGNDLSESGLSTATKIIVVVHTSY